MSLRQVNYIYLLPDRKFQNLIAPGIPISATRNEKGWFYEIKAQQDPELEKIIGAGGRGGKNYSSSIDKYLIEHIHARSRKKKAVAS